MLRGLSKQKIVIGICLPKNLLKQIDQLRGDVARSKYVSRIIERQLANKNDRDGQQNQPGLQPRHNFAISSTTGGAKDGHK